MTISNMVGPLDQIDIAGHHVRSFYFMVVGVPQVRSCPSGNLFGGPSFGAVFQRSLTNRQCAELNDYDDKLYGQAESDLRNREGLHR